MRIIPSSTSSEHWLTLMTCSICAHTPDSPPVFKCGQGHTICYPCFKKSSRGVPLCGICESDSFTRQDVSDEFLKKLKYKPGIGRARRYVTGETYPQPMLPFNDNDEAVTVEKLFQMSSSKIHQLFNDNTKDKLRQLNSFSYSGIANSYLDLKNEKRDEEICTVHTLEDKSSKIWLKRSIKDPKAILLDECSSSILSRKPLKCPHDPCNKIIAVSSFQDHFKYEHNEFQRYQLDRGNELVLLFDPALIQHDKTFCLAIIKLYESVAENTNLTQTSKVITRKNELDTFWVMVSGSPDDRPNHAYAVYWLFTNTNNEYKSTLELSSQHDIMAGTTFCGVNGIHESQNISDIARRLNCLFLTQGTLKSMLSYGPMMKFRITIH